MSINVVLTEAELNNVRQIAIQNRRTVAEIIQDTVSTFFSGKCSYIVFDKALPAEVLEEVREAVNRVVNKERSYIITPKNGRQL